MRNSLPLNKRLLSRLPGGPSPDNVVDWIITCYLGFILCYAVSHLGGYRAQVLANLSLMMGGLLGLHGIWLACRQNRQVRLNKLGFLFLPFFAYAVVSWLFITPVPWLAREEVLLWSHGLIIFWVVMHNLRSRKQIWFLMALISGITLMTLLYGFYQYFKNPEWLPMGRVQVEDYAGRASGTFGAPNSFAGMLELMIPFFLIGAFTRRFPGTLRVILFYLGCLCICGIVLSGSRGGLIGMGVSLLALPYFVSASRKRQILCLVLILLGGLAAGGALYVKMETFQERMDRILTEGGEHTRRHLWKAGWQIFLDHPLTGSGGASFDTYFERYRPENLQRKAVYAHNDYLNTLSDYGIVGFILLFGPGVYLALRAFGAWRQLPFLALPRGERHRKTPTSKLFLGGLLLGLGAFAVHLLVDFHLKVPALLYTATTMAGLAVKFSSRRTWELPRLRLAPTMAMAAALIPGGVVAVQGMLTFTATAYYKEGREGLNIFIEELGNRRESEQSIAEVIDLFNQATSLNPGHAHAWSDLGLSTLQTYHFHPGNYKVIGARAEEMTDRALALTGEVWSFYIHKGMALGMQAKPLEEIRPYFERSIELAPNSVDSWYYYAYFLSFDPDNHGEALKAVEKAIRLDPRKKSAIQLRAKLMLH